MTDKPLSRQRRWQLKKIAEGNCHICGKPRHLYPTKCDACYERGLESLRARGRHLSWKPGYRGRPPLWWKKQQEEQHAS